MHAMLTLFVGTVYTIALSFYSAQPPRDQVQNAGTLSGEKHSLFCIGPPSVTPEHSFRRKIPASQRSQFNTPLILSIFVIIQVGCETAIPLNRVMFQ